jgi:hypothetical protein
VHLWSKWFEKINFLVTQFTSYFNDRSKGFAQKECEEHFYPKLSLSSIELNYDFALMALDIFDFSALITICFFLLVISLMVLFGEIFFNKYSNREILYTNIMVPFSKVVHFSYKFKCANYIRIVEKFNDLQNRFFVANRIQILRSEIQTNISDEIFEITLSLVLQFNTPHQETAIKNELQALIFYPGAVSIY